MTAQAHISQLYNDRVNNKLWLESQLDIANFANGLLPGRFLNELLQNIDDAKGKAVHFTLIGEMLKVEHDGDHFSRTDVEKIVSFANQRIGGKSELSNVTGYKGIGFKALLSMAWKVQIISKGYSFRFDEKVWNGPMPWEMIPIWTEESNLNPTKVTFIFHLNNPKEVETQLNGFCQDPRSILYLRNVQTLDLKMGKINRVVTRQDALPLRKLVDTGSVRSQWLVYSSPNIEVPKEIRSGLENLNSTLCPDRLKKGKDPLKITFGFLLIENVVAPLSDSIEIYTTLPTKLRLGFPFTVNAEFLLEAQRESLISNPWNDFLFEQLAHYQFYFLRELASGDQWKNVLNVLGPSSIKRVDQSLSDAYLKGYKRGALEFAWIPSFVDPKQLLKLEESFMDGTRFYYTMKDKLPKEAIPRYLVNPELTNFQRLERMLKWLNSRDILVSLEKIFQKEKNKELCFHILSFFKANKWYWNDLKEYSWVPTEDDTLEKLSNLSFPAEEVIPKPPAFIHIPVMNKAILSFDKKGDLRKWLMDQGVKPISAKGIVEHYIVRFVHDKKVDVHNTIPLVQYLFELFCAGLIQDSDLKSLQNMPMLNLEDTLVPIKDLFLSSDYIPQQNPDLKTILPKNLFLHPGYRGPIPDPRWIDFLRALGAQEKCGLYQLQATTIEELQTLKISYLDQFLDYLYNQGQRIIGRNYSSSDRYRNFFYFPMMSYLTKPEFSFQFWQVLSDYGKKFIEMDQECQFIDGKNSARTLCSSTYNKSSYIKFVLNKIPLIPGTDGKPHIASDLYTPAFKSLKIKEIVAADLNVPISDELATYFGFKTVISPHDCFSFLQKMKNDQLENLDLYIDLMKNLISGWKKLDEKEKQRLLKQNWHFLAHNNTWQPVSSLKYFGVKGATPSLHSNQWFKNVTEEMQELAQIFNRPIVAEYVQENQISEIVEDQEIRANIFNKLPLVAWIRAHFLMKAPDEVLKSLVATLKNFQFFTAKSILSMENNSIDLVRVQNRIYSTEKCPKQRVHDKIVDCFEFDAQGAKDFLEILSLKPMNHTRHRKTEADWIKERKIPEEEINKLRELLKTLDPAPSLTTTDTVTYSPHLTTPLEEKIPPPEQESPFKPEPREIFPIEKPLYNESKEEEDLTTNLENLDLNRELFPVTPNQIKPQDQIPQLKTPQKRTVTSTEKSQKPTSSFKAPPSDKETTEIGLWGEQFALNQLVHKYTTRYLKKYSVQAQQITPGHYKWTKETTQIELKWINSQKETGVDHDFELIKNKNGVQTIHPIEVKSTTGSKVHFFMSDNEKQLMDNDPKKYRLYIVLFAKTEKATLYQIKNPKLWIENSIIRTRIKYEVQGDLEI